MLVFACELSKEVFRIKLPVGVLHFLSAESGIFVRMAESGIFVRKAANSLQVLNINQNTSHKMAGSNTSFSKSHFPQ